MAGFLLIGVSLIGYKINSGLNEPGEAFHVEHNLMEPGFILLRSEVSPDNKHQFFEYQFDNGGFGYSRVFWSVIENDSTVSGLENGLLPDGYRILKWSDNSELLIEKWTPYYYMDKKVGLKSGELINGVQLLLEQ